MLRQVQGGEVLLKAAVHRLLFCGQRTEVTLRAVTSVWWVTSRAPVQLGRDRCHLWLPRRHRGTGSRASSSSCSLCRVWHGDLPLAGASWGHPSEESQDITETVLPSSVPLAGFILLEFMQLLSIAV